MNKYKKVLEKFIPTQKIEAVEPYGEGHINTTFLVSTDSKRYIMQRINNRIFPNIDNLMCNIVNVTEFLKKKGIPTLDVIRTIDNKSYATENGEYFRVYKFIENSVVYQTVEDEGIFEEAGFAFGEFQKFLSDFDTSMLYEIIPDFHNTPKRFNDFLSAYNADKEDRLKECVMEAEFILKRKDSLSKVVDGLNNGSIPLRVTHNDTKLNNILMDIDTGKAKAIIDLDTIMPGSMLYDFGDSIRFGASTATEDERDVSKVHFSKPLYDIYENGFTRAMDDAMTPTEKELMPYGAYLMTIECGIRFLTDFLSGDIYFKTKYREHNLVRCRTQLKLAGEIEAVFNMKRSI